MFTTLRTSSSFTISAIKREMEVPEMRVYLSHLAVDKMVAASTQNLLFLYQQVLQIKLPLLDGIEPAKRPQRISVVFNPYRS